MTSADPANQGDTMLPPNAPDHDDTCGEPGNACPGCVGYPLAPHAVQLTEDADWQAIADWCGGRLCSTRGPDDEYTSAVEFQDRHNRLQAAFEDDWIVRGPYGEFDVVPGEVAQTIAATRTVTEHAVQMSGGGMHVRWDDPEMDRIYPLNQWIPNQQRFGGKVYRRTIIVVEDWTEVPR